MTGLILKDFLILRKTLRTYLLFIALYTGLVLAGVWSAEFAGGFLMVIIAILPMNVFAYDKQAKWDTYGLALPIGRTKTVAARYLCVLLLCLLALVIMAALGIVLHTMGRIEEPASYLVTCAVTGFTAVLMNAVMLPQLYKFGPEQARVMLYVLMGLIAGLVFLFLIPLGGLEWLKTLGEPTPAQLSAVPMIVVPASMLLLAASFFLSRHFYGKKDI